MRLRTPLLAALLLLLLLPAGDAAARDRAYAVQITGAHVIDWEFRGENWPDRCLPWGAGQGRQTIGFSTRRAMTFTGRATQHGFSWFPRTLGTWRTTLSRTGEWDTNVVPPNCVACGPGSEYGPCPDDPPLAGLWTCDRRTLDGTRALAAYAPKGARLQDGTEIDEHLVAVKVSVDTGEPYRNCPPDVLGGTRKFHTPVPMQVEIETPDAGRLPKLKVDGKLTLKGSVELGWAAPFGRNAAHEEEDCAKAKVERGWQECATTDVTVQIRRTR